MKKDKNIFELYSQLSNNGSKGKALAHIANLCDCTKGTVKSHWLGNREFPQYVTDSTKDDIIIYLQNTIKQQNKVSA